jgi:hypothetical protein
MAPQTSHPTQSTSTRFGRRQGICFSAALALAALAVGCASKGEASDTTSIGTDADPILQQAIGDRTLDEVLFDIEEKVQACMTALGWEYTAVAPSAAAGGLAGTDDPDEFARTYGYGISGAGASGQSSQSDPNQTYQAALSPADSAQYFEDLYGQAQQTGAAGDLGGCYGDATNALFANGELETLEAAYERLDEIVSADPKVIDAYAKWSACMADKGYSFTVPADASNSIQARVSALDASAAEDALAAVQAEELDTAIADRECAKEHVDAVVAEVQADAARNVVGGS